ncbi:hypothetical protein N8955_01190 [bacterium]|nr:hypothetical protein [bacterium]
MGNKDMKRKVNNNSIPSVTEIVSGMNAVAPRSNKNNRGLSYEAIATEYLLKTINELVNAKVVDGLKQIYIANIQFEHRYKNSKRWYSYLRDNYPLFIMIHPGISMTGVSYASQVKSLVSDTELLEYRLNNDFGSLYEWNTDANTIDIPIDSNNLLNYILDTCNRIEQANDSVPEYKQKLVRNAAQALSIKDCANANGGAMRHTYTIADSGRLYMKGLNLQQCASEVREAALGSCYKYDISSASFALRLGYIKTNQPTAKTPALLDLVQNKQYIRDKLVTECLLNTRADTKTKLKIIKKSINAIGFGAKIQPHSPSLKKYIWSITDRAQFCEHPFIQELQAELKLFTQLVKQEVPNRRAKAIMPTLTGNFSASKFESHVYQTLETKAMEKVMANTSKEVIFWCHDAIYTRSKDDLASMNYVLQQQPYMQYAKFEGEEVTGWDNPYTQNSNYVITPAQEEQLAQDYISKFVEAKGFTKWDQQQLDKQAWRELYEV